MRGGKKFPCRTAEEAEAKYRVIRDLVMLEDALAYLGRYFDHHDFTQYDPDAPFPELGDVGRNSFQSTTDRIKRKAKDKGLTLREVALSETAPRDNFIGTPEKIASEIIRWIDAGAADGFILGFPVIAEGLDDFLELVVPLQKERGYFDGELKGATLRENLGLPFRASRYAEPATDEKARA